MGYTVYVHKNLKNEKYYVGCTKLNPKRRWHNGWGYQNNSKMWKDIQESNWNTDWVHGILGKFENEQDALKYEAFLIAMLGTIENGYNTSEYGGFSCKHSEESRNKISKSMGVNGILQFSKSGEFIAEYPSIMEAERLTGCNHSNIIKCCKGKYKSTGGYIWMYAS